jgi:hypothetical protein
MPLIFAAKLDKMITSQHYYDVINRVLNGIGAYTFIKCSDYQHTDPRCTREENQPRRA